MKLYINKKPTKKKKNLLKDNEDRIIGLVNDYLYPIKKKIKLVIKWKLKSKHTAESYTQETSPIGLTSKPAT